MDNCDIIDPDIFIPINNLDSTGCIFKKHCPEY